ASSTTPGASDSGYIGLYSVHHATKSWSRSPISSRASLGLSCPVAKTTSTNRCSWQPSASRGKDAALGKPRTLSTFPPLLRRTLDITKVCGGEKETNQQSNGVSENLLAIMRSL